MNCRGRRYDCHCLSHTGGAIAGHNHDGFTYACLIRNLSIDLFRSHVETRVRYPMDRDGSSIEWERQGHPGGSAARGKPLAVDRYQRPRREYRLPAHGRDDSSAGDLGCDLPDRSSDRYVAMRDVQEIARL